MNKTGIVILNYNNYLDTINCIESVYTFNTSDAKYIVVDNGSTNPDATREIDKYLRNRFPNDYMVVKDTDSPLDYYPTAVFCISENNDGYARGNNKGLKIAFADNSISDILVLNNDVLFTSDILQQLKKYLYRLNDVAVISPLLYKKNGKDIDYNCARKNISNNELVLNYLFMDHNFLGIKNTLKEKRLILKSDPELIDSEYVEIELPSGSCMLINKAVFNKIGGFDPGTFLFYEENILYKKFSLLGLHSYLIPCVSCIHLGGESRSKVSSKFVLQKESESVLFYAKNYANLNLPQRMVLRFSVRLFQFLLKSFK